MNPLVSIIVPIYNVEKYIERCARSIFEQTYENLEILFINDCTQDSSMEVLQTVLKKYPNRQSQTKIINFERNQGVATVRKVGIKNAIGKYSIQFDSDDFVAATMITDLVTLAEQKNADITICDFMSYSKGNSTHKKINPPLEKNQLLTEILTGKVHSSLCNKLIRHTLYSKYNIYPTEGLNMQEDLSIMYKLIYFADIIQYIPKPLYFYCNEQTTSYTHIGMTSTIQMSKNILIKQINQFIDTYKINNNLKQAFSFFKMGVKAGILLDGDLNEYKKNNIFEQFSINDIFKHPHLNLNYKIALILEHFQLYPILQLHRTIYHHVYKRIYNQLYKFYRDYKKFQQSKK